MGTKNNPKNRKAVKKQQYNNQEIEPVLYNGVHVGHGKYITAKYAGSNKIVVDAAQRPIPWEELVQ